MEFHKPVLVEEVLSVLDVTPGNLYLDGTLGNAGHTLEILKKGGIVYGIDQDPINLDIATNRIKDSGFADKFHPILGNFSSISSIKELENVHFDGALFDLGLSSGQLKDQGRGFSFNDPSSLDMRLDPTIDGVTAEEIINTYSYEELFDIFSIIAQEKFSKPLSIVIIRERQKKPFKTATQLAEVIRKFYKDKGVRTSIDPSTKIFMALRIMVNNEYENLKSLLNQTISAPHFSDSKIAIITFHSGEDRIVKQFVKKHEVEGKLISLHNRPILPSTEEIRQNPLSRSSVLRSYKVKL